MESLYGGHQGSSFVLRAEFDSIASMVAQGQKGGDYKDVWYNEYCIINTPNKNDPDNGKIFLRGINYLETDSDGNPTGGWIPVGQVVGPSSGTPYFQLGSIPFAQEHVREGLQKYEYRVYPSGLKDDGTYNLVKEEGVLRAADETKNAGTFDFSQDVDQALVPGKEPGKDVYHDTIKYTWVNIRKDDEDADSWFYVGVQQPYPQIDVAAHSSSPYDDNGHIRTNGMSVEEKSEKNPNGTRKHPYYEFLDFGIPHGIKGDAVRKLRVTTPAQETGRTIYDINDLVTNANGELTPRSGAGSYADYTDDRNRQIVVFDVVTFDHEQQGESYSVYLGDFNIIKNVQVSDNGTLTVSYTHDDDTVYDRKIKWVNAIQINTNQGAGGGAVSVNYNVDGPDVWTNLGTLKYVSDVDIADDGTVTFTYINNDRKQYSKLIRWVKSVSLDGNGKFTLVANNDASPNNPFYSTVLNWVKEVSFDTTNGSMTVTTTDGTASGKKDVRQNILKLITGAMTDGAGKIMFTTNTGETITLHQTDASGKDSGNEFRLITITGVTLDDSLTGDKRIQVTYNTGNTDRIGTPMNAIYDMVIRPSDFHLLVLYTDPTHRASGTTVEGQTTVPASLPADNSTKSDWVLNGPSSNQSAVSSWYNKAPKNNDTVWWKDFGSVRDQSGVLVGLNIDNTWTKGEDVVTYLNRQFPNGLTSGSLNQAGTAMGANVAQKVVTYAGDSSSGKTDKEFYAYDYNLNSWYYLGTIADSGTRDVLMTDRGSVTNAGTTNLNTKGLVFSTEKMTVNDDAMPKYWDPTYVW